MVHTIVDGAFRQTNLANESSEYLAKREELRLAEIASPSCAAIFRRAFRFRTMRFKRAPATSTPVTRPCAPHISANFSPSPIARSSSIT